jgi:molecular chaperone DnaK
MNEPECEAIGIDLGTTYSSLAYVDAQGLPRIVCDSNGNTVIPSVVFFDTEEIVVGDVALSQAKVRAERCVQFIKVQMGEQWRQTFDGQVHTPESISALILGHLLREAEPQIGLVKKAVITVPAYFTEKRRRATQQAGEIAGLNVIGTLNEPMSAALAYGLHRTDREHFAAIYDLGGGTFDVTIVRITPNEIEELATAGNRQLGGRDWDQAIVDFVREEFRKQNGRDPQESPQALQDLLIECEKAKRRLSRMAKTAIRLHAFGHDHVSEITREDFERRTEFLTQSTKLTTELALEDAGLDWGKLSRVVLVGGSTQMPAIRKMLKDASRIEPDSGVNPVVAVALGAAIYANILTTGSKFKTLRQKEPTIVDEDLPVGRPLTKPGAKESVSAAAPAPGDRPPPRLPVAKPLAPPVAPSGSSPALPHVRFVTAHGVGVKSVAAGAWQNSVLIPKNTPVPAKVTKRFRTSGNAQTSKPNKFIAIEITQGDTTESDLAEVVGTGTIQLPPDETVGNPVDVTLEFDAQGRLHASALYVKTAQIRHMTLDVRGGLRADEVETYRHILDRSGYGIPFDAQQALENLELADDDLDEEPPLIEPV